MRSTLPLLVRRGIPQQRRRPPPPTPPRPEGQRRTFARASSSGGSFPEKTPAPPVATMSRAPGRRSAAAAAPVALIFDTETTGKVDFARPSTDPSQPDLVQLGMVLVETSTWTPRMVSSLHVRLRDGSSVDPSALAAHGISDEECDRFGLPLPVAADLFREACGRADVLVAHNLAFDGAVMEAALHRGRGMARARAPGMGLEDSLVDLVPDPSLAADRLCPRRVCTMRSCTDVLKIRGRFGRGGGYKWPSLAEAYGHFTGGKALEGGHDALVDAEACLVVFRGLVESGAISLEPEAKEEEAEGSVEVPAASRSGAAHPKRSTVVPIAAPCDAIQAEPPPTTMGRTARPGDLNISLTLEGFDVGGYTYQYRRDLKSFGGKWDPIGKKWKFDDCALLRQVTRFVGPQRRVARPTRSTARFSSLSGEGDKARGKQI